jgi:hypothetical protein
MLCGMRALSTIAGTLAVCPLASRAQTREWPLHLTEILALESLDSTGAQLAVFEIEFRLSVY